MFSYSPKSGTFVKKTLTGHFGDLHVKLVDLTRETGFKFFDPKYSVVSLVLGYEHRRIFGRRFSPPEAQQGKSMDGRRKEWCIFKPQWLKRLTFFIAALDWLGAAFWAYCCLRTQGRSVLHKVEFTSTSGNMKTYLSPPSHSAASQLVICLLLQGCEKMRTTRLRALDAINLSSSFALFITNNLTTS